MNWDPIPSCIVTLNPGQVFVYGANRAGIHGAGAARLALRFGAVTGETGHCGRTYGICTKDYDIQTLGLAAINSDVAKFLRLAEVMGNEFLVTAIGCGLAGYTPEDIAPMFWHAPDNVRLPKSFLDVLQRHKTKQP